SMVQSLRSQASRIFFSLVCSSSALAGAAAPTPIARTQAHNDAPAIKRTPRAIVMASHSSSTRSPSRPSEPNLLADLWRTRRVGTRPAQQTPAHGGNNGPCKTNSVVDHARHAAARTDDIAVDGHGLGRCEEGHDVSNFFRGDDLFHEVA